MNLNYKILRRLLLLVPLLLTFFCPLISFAQLTYNEPICLSLYTWTPYSVASADFDGDDDNDILSGSHGRVVWYENVDGLGNFGVEHEIVTGYLVAQSVVSADLDGDSDYDAVIGYSEFGHPWEDNLLAWFENQDGMGNFGEMQVITEDADSVMSVYIADLDGDGDNDIMSASMNDDKIAWYENTDGLGDFSQELIITSVADSAISVYSADIDGDGDYDVLSASAGDDKIAWYENENGLGDFGEQQVITQETDGASCVFSADIDGDGDYDILSSSFYDSTIAWYENTDGLGAFGPQQVITLTPTNAHSVFSTDLDGDGDNDVLVSAVSQSYDDEELSRIRWYENTDGLGNFDRQQSFPTDTYRNQSIYYADLDSDDDLDILASFPWEYKIVWYEHTDGLGDYDPYQLIVPSAGGAKAVFGSDIDGDGDLDIVAASKQDNKVAWYENTDGLEEFGPQNVITTELDDASIVFCIDIDGDEDQDIIAGGYGNNLDDNRIVWFENIDGTGTCGPEQLVTTTVTSYSTIFSADLDNDDDNDILVATPSYHQISWYENIDGIGDFSEQHVVDDDLDYVKSVFSIDLDGDGDNDILAASSGDTRIVWYRNNGSGEFGQPDGVDFLHLAQLVTSADLDGDGDNDVVGTSRSWFDPYVSWYENTDGEGEFGPRQVLVFDDYDFYDIKAVFCADLDSDGDNDIVVGSRSRNDIFWFENEDGRGSFSPHQGLFGTGNLTSVFGADFDNDLDIDIVTSADSEFSDYGEIVYRRCDLFVLEPVPPDSFNLLQPDSGSFFDRQAILLEWEEAFDHNNELVVYRVYASQNIDDLTESFIDTTTSTYYEFYGDNVAEYWWTVLAIDPGGLETWANQVFSFSVESGLSPLPFNLLQPDSASEFADSPDVNLEWEEIVDPDDNFALYRVHVTDNLDNINFTHTGGTINTSYTFTGENGNRYWWTISARDERFNVTWANQVYSFTIDMNSVKEQGNQEIPTDYELTSIYPNPFNPDAIITVGLPNVAFLHVDVFNILGQQVASLAGNRYQAGYHNFNFNGTELSSGIYFVQAIVPGKMNEVSKLLLIK